MKILKSIVVILITLGFFGGGCLYLGIPTILIFGLEGTIAKIVFFATMIIPVPFCLLLANKYEWL